MASFTLTVPDNKVDRVLDACEGLYPIPQVPVEDTDPIEYEPEFTKAQWGKECLRRYVISTVRRYEQREAMNTAAQGVVPDNGIAS